jgi:hypothetical protein
MRKSVSRRCPTSGDDLEFSVPRLDAAIYAAPFSIPRPPGTLRPQAASAARKADRHLDKSAHNGADKQSLIYETGCLTSVDTFRRFYAIVDHLRHARILAVLRWSDLNSQDFARLVPRTPCWRLAHLPPRLPWEDLLATTGLRNKELRSLELQDIHWRAAEVLVRRPKAGRDRVVPLVQEAGKALAEYVNGYGANHTRPAQNRPRRTQTSPTGHRTFPSAADAFGLNSDSCDSAASVFPPFTAAIPIPLTGVRPLRANCRRCRYSLDCAPHKAIFAIAA